MTSKRERPASWQKRLVRHPRGKWLYTTTLDAEEWMGCTATLEQCLDDAAAYLADEGLPADTPIFVAHGWPLPKRECDEWGMDWPWYQVEREQAMKVCMPNGRSEL